MDHSLQEYPSLTLVAGQSALTALSESVYKGQIDDLNEPVFNLYNSGYQKAITGIKDVEKAKMYQNNVSRLAAAKTSQITRELSRARADQNGVVRAKTVFDKESKLIINKYNRYQAAEYNTMVHRTRVAKQFGQFEAEKHLYPFVEWLRTRSANPRPDHLEYVGRRWRLDDPFWSENQPGCIWQCKCSWKNTTEPETDNSKLQSVPASAGLEGNPYYTDELVTDSHPYYKGTKPHIANLGPLHNPDDIAYVDSRDGKWKEHYNCLQDQETPGNRKLVPYMIDLGYNDIKLLPRINAKETSLRERYYGKTFEQRQSSKCPDAIVDGLLVEFKEVNVLGRNISDAINDAAVKADIAVINVVKTMQPEAIESLCTGKMKQHKNLKEIVLINNGKVHDYKR